jgi:hypothetical protein
VRHGTGPTGPEGWVITWYDSDHDISYSLLLYERLARELGAGLNPKQHAAAAHRLEAIASSLVPLTLDSQ